MVRPEDLSSLVAAARYRLGRQIIDDNRLQWGERLRRIPLTSEEE